jgi:thymidylate kinase
VVSVSGVDSAGKTTQIEVVARWLELRGYRCTVLFYRPGFSRALNLAKNLARRGVPSAMPTRDQAQRRAVVFGRPLVRRVWVALALVDTLVHFAVMVRLARLRSDVVVCDRYVDDAELDFEFNFSRGGAVVLARSPSDPEDLGPSQSTLSSNAPRGRL